MKILLVKLSSLGDVVHTLPVVQDIVWALPGAQIDWVVEKSFAPLLHPLQLSGGGLRRVIACELRRWRQSLVSSVADGSWGRFKAELQDERYDAVIDLQGLSKSALVAWMARLAPGGKRFAMANQTEGSSFEAPTRWVASTVIRMEPHSHAVQRGRALAAQALGYTVPYGIDFGLTMRPAQLEWSQTAPEIIAGDDGFARVALVHGTSRADKQWPVACWIELGERLNAAGFEVVLPHGSVDEYSTSHVIARALNDFDDGAPGARVLPVQPLDALTSALAGYAGVIGVDSGVSHIAMALDVPHVQLYNFDTAWRTGPPIASSSGVVEGRRQLSVFAQPFPEVDAVWQAWLACATAGGAVDGEGNSVQQALAPFQPDFADTQPTLP